MPASAPTERPASVVHDATRDPADMTDLPKAGRAELVEAMLPTLLTPVRHLEADGGATVKSVWRLHDGALIESVLMRYSRRVFRSKQWASSRPEAIEPK